MMKGSPVVSHRHLNPFKSVRRLFFFYLEPDGRKTSFNTHKIPQPTSILDKNLTGQADTG